MKTFFQLALCAFVAIGISYPAGAQQFKAAGAPQDARIMERFKAIAGGGVQPIKCSAKLGICGCKGKDDCSTLQDFADKGGCKLNKKTDCTNGKPQICTCKLDPLTSSVGTIKTR